jgi:hypothetical protein
MATKKTQVIFAGRDVTRFYSTAKLFGNGEENPKLGKNKRISYIMYLAPAKYGKTPSPTGGLINTCPNASPDCIATCLNTTGSPAFFKTKFKARIDKAALYFYDKPFFIQKMASEIIGAAFLNRNDEVAIRVNGTSDLPLVEDLISAGYIYEIPKNVIFYDYTKDPLKAGLWKLPSGHMYIVAFSRSEKNQAQSIAQLKKGALVAVVFRKALPKKWFGFDVIDGDNADDIMVDLAKGKYVELDPTSKKPTGNVYVAKKQGYVLGLQAKGSLRNFKSKQGAKGFVIDCDNYENCTIG